MTKNGLIRTLTISSGTRFMFPPAGKIKAIKDITDLPGTADISVYPKGMKNPVFIYILEGLMIQTKSISMVN